MADYHFVYKDVEGASTQWDDIQRKLGNLPEKPPAFSPATDPNSLPKEKTWVDGMTEEELEDLEVDPSLGDDRFLENIDPTKLNFLLELIRERKKRLAEMREAAKVRKYGSVVPISGSDFVREVSQAPPEVWVVLVLYKDGIHECGVLMQRTDELAARYPATKFVKIISTDCIPNYPDCNLPTLLVYNNGSVKANYVGSHTFGRRYMPESVALVLCQSNPVLNDGHSGGDESRRAVIDGVRKRFIEKVVADHEDNDDGSSSD